MAKSKRCAIFLFCCLLFLAYCSDVKAGRTSSGSNRRSGGGSTRRQPSSNTGHVTKPSYNVNSGHSDLTKLSYPSNNAQPNHVGSTGTQSGPPIGWNVPKQQGPPPVYSANNPIGGAKTNMYEQAPAYRPNNAPPPNYAASNVHTPITATNTHGVQSSYPQQQHGASYYPAGQAPAGATYYPAGHAPAGATYYPAGHAPAGATYYPSGHVPAGANYYPGGHMPAGGTYYPQSAALPQGATYLPAGAALPAGATYYSSPPQSSSSGLGFGSGLAAGALGGALLGHALTPQTRVVEQAPAGGGHSSGDDKVIIINNGPPGSVQTTQAGGTTVITTNNQQPVPQAADPNAPPAAAVATGAAAAATVPLAPLAASPTSDNSTTDAATVPAPMPAAGPEQPPPGGIVCVPVKVNETDPNDATKMVEVEKIACYPAPQPPPEAAAQPPPPVPATAENNSGVPLAPMNPVPAQTSQQMQQNPNTQTAGVLASTNKASAFFDSKCSFMMFGSILGLLFSHSFN